MIRQRATAIAACLAAVVATACGANEIYTVKSVADHVNAANTIRVVCVSNKGNTKVRQWEPLVQIAPEVGDEWLCNLLTQDEEVPT